MKRTMLSLLPALFFMTLFLMAFNFRQEPPKKIKSYIQQHFPEQSVKKAKYKVYLDKGVKIEFDKNYHPIEIDGKAGLPESVIPKKIMHYAKQNYPGKRIIEWEKKTHKQEVELENGIELEFDLEGNFLKVD